MLLESAISIIVTPAQAEVSGEAGKVGAVLPLLLRASA
jgi:hypothetical protein